MEQMIKINKTQMKNLVSNISEEVKDRWAEIKRKKKSMALMSLEREGNKKKRNRTKNKIARQSRKKNRGK